MSSRDEQVASFVSLTGADVKTAEGLLEACNMELESAVQLYFDTQAGPTPQSDAALAASMQQQQTSTSQPNLDLPEEVRAPIPIKRDTLYGDGAEALLRYQSRSRLNPTLPPQDLNAFRDFQAEGRGMRGGTKSQVQGLAGLFQAPSALTFQGTFEEAKAQAVQEGKWLMVNVQSNSQFASHQLNRDTWSDPTLTSIIMGSFIFWQVYDSSDLGGRFMSFYRLSALDELPLTLILDPITGAKQRQLTGFIEPQRLAEDLVPFMDHDIHHPSAHKLATQHKRKSTQMQHPKKKALTEEEELELALAMSVEGSQPQASSSAPAGAAASASGPAPSPAPAPSAAAAKEAENAFSAANGVTTQETNEASVIAEAKARLPAEPGPPDPNACRIAVRLPSGVRLQRTFSKTDPVSALQDYCIVQAEGAASRPFKLMQTFPGAPPLADASQSLDAAGLAGGMVALKWSD
ncbi:hypothetical protein ABBQ32_007693 [Trebouxia sp. C0010 RCD-2024]